MLSVKFNKISNNFNRKLLLIIKRTFSEAETLEPVKLSYATYENTRNNIDGPQKPPPLVIMHGLFGSKSNWNSLCKVYEQKTKPQRKIIAIDARNHGDSPHNQNHTYAHMVADVRSLLDHLHIENAAFMGHSMGGRALMLFALKYPEFVEKLIVADISPITTSPNLNTMPKLFSALEHVEMPKNVPMSRARNFVDEQLQKFISDSGLRAFLLTNLVNDNDRYKWRINIPVLVSSFNNIAKFPSVGPDMVYKGPVLFAAGEASDYVPKSIIYRQNEAVKIAYASYNPTESSDTISPYPLILLHGILGSKGNWNSLAKQYVEKTQPKRKIFALDARNHGDSSHNFSHTYEDMILDLRQFFTELNIEKACILGHSMGGRTGMLFALKFPNLVEKLIVSDISSIKTYSETSEVLATLKNIQLPKNVTLSEAQTVISKQLMNFLPNRKLVGFLLTNLIISGNGSFGWRVNIPALIHNFKYINSFPEVFNAKFDGPVLFLGGTKSNFPPQSDFPQIQQLFPNAELKYIEGAGHWLHAEKPADFLNITLDFLNKHE